MEIQCSKPDCFWSGAPSDAADHECPTPDPALALVADLPHEPAAPAGEAPLFATKADLEHWLADHGVYTATGEPANAETIEADRQYALFVAAEKADADKAAAPPPEPDLDAEPPGVDRPADDDEIEGRETFDDDPWQIRVTLQFQARDDHRQMKWVIVDEDAAELLDAYPLKQPAEEKLVEWLHGQREATLWRASDLVKAATALEDAAEQAGGPDRENGGPDREPEPSAIEKLEQAAAAAGGHLVTEETDVIQHPDDPTGIDAGIPSTGQETRPEPNVQPLFDAADYDKPGLQIPKVDGHAIDRISIGFGGSVMLDRSEPKDVQLYNRIHGQQTVELWVEAKWGGTGAKPATNRDGDLDVIVGSKSLRVEAIRIVDADQLGELEGLEMVRAATRRARRAGVPDDQIENACIDTLAETD